MIHVAPRSDEMALTYQESALPVHIRPLHQIYELVPNEYAARGGGGGISAQELPKNSNLSRRAAMR